MDDAPPAPSLNDAVPAWRFGRPDDLEHRPAWSLLDYRLGVQRDAARAALRRELRDLHAVGLKQGTWAVPHPVSGEARVAALAARVREAGGTATTRPVGYDDPADRALQARLNRACERLWDSVADAADELLPPRPVGTELDPDDALAVLVELRPRFAAARADDIVASDTGFAVGRRLDHLAAALPPDPPRPGRVEVVLRSSWRLTGGSLGWVATLVPLPDPRWDAAFSRFEAFAYRPSDERVPVRHGTFRGACPPDGLGNVVSALEQRIRRFHQAQG